VYLSYGLAAVLGFIGLKLILEALHGNDLPFINGGKPIEWAPHIPIWLSLTVIVVALGVATIASLMSSRGRPRRAGDGQTRTGEERPATSSADAARDQAAVGASLDGRTAEPTRVRDHAAMHRPAAEGADDEQRQSNRRNATT
jgi:tellurite resistance protein TerC